METQYSHTPGCLRLCLMPSLPVLYLVHLLFFNTRTWLYAVECCSVKGLLWCLSSCGFLLKCLSLIRSPFVSKLALAAQKPMCVSCTCRLWLRASQQGGAVSNKSNTHTHCTVQQAGYSRMTTTTCTTAKSMLLSTPSSKASTLSYTFP